MNVQNVIQMNPKETSHSLITRKRKVLELCGSKKKKRKENDSSSLKNPRKTLVTRYQPGNITRQLLTLIAGPRKDFPLVISRMI